jgi:hypothetical protein
MGHRHKRCQHLLIARISIVYTLPSFIYININPSALILHNAGQVILAYLQSSFPSQAMRGTYRNNFYLFIKVHLRGVDFVPLITISFFGQNLGVSGKFF